MLNRFEPLQVLCRTGIQLVLNSKVQSVEKNRVQIDTNGKISTIPFGACIWSTGVAMHPLVKQLQVCCMVAKRFPFSFKRSYINLEIPKASYFKMKGVPVALEDL